MSSQAEVVERCRRIIARHSQSFSLASRLLGPRVRDEAVIVYAWCRRADDEVDLALNPAAARQALERLKAELAQLEEGIPTPEGVLAAFGAVMASRAIPYEYPRELLAGMEMDVAGTTYPSLPELLHYCFRVAGTVGLMMSHVMGVASPRALRRAAHLGIAMQLTNIARDVAEDWSRGRMYLPTSFLAEAGGTGPWGVGSWAKAPLAHAVRRLLREADRYYASARVGLGELSPRSALATRTAHLVYAAIGDELARRDHNVLSGRAVVPRWRKLLLLSRALAETSARLPRNAVRPFQEAPLDAVVRFPGVLLP